MKPWAPITAPVVVVLVMATVCGASPEMAPAAGPATASADQATEPLTTAAVTTTTQPVTLVRTSAPPTPALSLPATEDPGDLYALDIASGTIRRLTSDPRLDGAPAWMPAGEQLLFGRLVSGADPTTGNSEVFLAVADGTLEQQLTDHPAPDFTPRSSPDGSTIVFTTERDGNP
jgi:Tol biopolymer transport system component